jgi:hypothetical protein
MRSLIGIILMVGLTAGCAHGSRTHLRSPVQGADSPVGTWELVQRLSTGTRISVAQVGGGTAEGELAAVNGEGLDISSTGGRLQIPRAAIRRVTVTTGVSHRTGAKRGFLIGAAAGALVAGLTVESNRGPWTVSAASDAARRLGASQGGFRVSGQHQHVTGTAKGAQVVPYAHGRRSGTAARVLRGNVGAFWADAVRISA